MEFLNSLLHQGMGGFGPIIAMGVVGLVAILLAIPLYFKQKNDPLEKLSRQTSQAMVQPSQAKLRASRGNEKLQRYASYLEPQNKEEYSAIRQKLRQAGYRAKDAVRYYYFAQFALAIIGLIIGVSYYFLLKSGSAQMTTQKAIMWILGPGLVGYMAPKYWVTKRQQERQEQIQSGFPDALDLLLVCIEAGQSLDQAIIRVAHEIRTGFPALADEFTLVSHEIKAGKDKPTVLRDMADRCGVQDISSFVTVLIQSVTFGTPIADALRVYAGEMRDKRVMRAEEKANKLPTKMTLVTMTLTVPPLLIILIGPSLIGLTKLSSVVGQ